MCRGREGGQAKTCRIEKTCSTVNKTNNCVVYAIKIRLNGGTGQISGQVDGRQRVEGGGGNCWRWETSGTGGH